MPASSLFKFLIIELLNSFRYIVRFQIRQTVNIYKQYYTAPWTHEVSSKRMQSLLPSQAPESLYNSQKKELLACMHARQVESHAKFLEHKTTQMWRQYLFLGEKRSITCGFGDGKERTAWNCIFLSRLGTRDWGLGSWLWLEFSPLAYWCQFS